MKKIILLFFLFLGTKMLLAQNKELGKVTIEELKEKLYPNDTTAAAAILFEKGNTSFTYSQDDGFRISTEVDIKIKIYKKDGYEWANQAVPFYIGGKTSEDVLFTKAVTYNLVNGQIEKTKLKSEGQFIEKINNIWSLKKITMPNVKEGSIIEYRYTIQSPYFSSFPAWEFQKTIPVLYSEYSTYIPEYFYYNSHSKGSLYPVVTKNSVSKIITLKDKAYINASYVTAKGTDQHTENINYLENQTSYTLKEVPALKEEAFVDNLKNYATSIEHEFTGSKMPMSRYESYANSWEDVAKKIYANDNFGAQLKKDNYFEEDIKLLLVNTKTKEEKIASIFEYVKSRVNWNKVYGYTCKEGVKKAYQDKVGNVAEINLMLVAMLRYAEINANPILVSTRQNGISYYPSFDSFNYVIAGVELNNEIVLLDATNENSLPNILPIRDLNWIGRMILPNGTSSAVPLNPSINSNTTVSIMSSIDKDGKLEGKIREQYTAYNAFQFRENHIIKNDSYLEKLEKKLRDIEISEYSITNEDSIYKPIIETYSFKSGNSVEVIADKMYFSPLLFFAQLENPFKQEKREYPVDFIYPNEEKYIVSITIPEGYMVETMPSPILLTMNDNLGSLKYTLINKANQIQLSATFSINSARIQKDRYEELKAFYTGVIQKENEKIILKKI